MRYIARLRPSLATVLCLGSLLVTSPHAENLGEWPAYGADKASSKYAPLTHLTRDNVQQLRVVWRWYSVDQPILQTNPNLWPMVNEATPLMVGGVGEHRWMRPMGEGPRHHPALVHLNLPPLGSPRRSFVLATKSLLFVAQEGITRGRGFSPGGNALELSLENYEPFLLALDPANGDLIAQIALPGNATGSPMTYQVDGKQYIVVPIGGASLPAELVALSVP
jgi:hypothetical protein